MGTLKESPSLADSLATETREGATQRDRFPERLDRYGKAKALANRMYDYIKNTVPDTSQNLKLASALFDCGNYLVFRDYYTVGQIRLSKACFCKKHLLCPLCAIRRGTKQVQSKMSQVKTVLSENNNLEIHMVTFTVKDGGSLTERFKHLSKSIKIFMKRRGRKNTVSESHKIHGAVWSYEFKKGKNSNLWHPHVHMIVLVDKSNPIIQNSLSEEWHSITKDSFIVDVRKIKSSTEEEMVKGFCEVFKYAVKFSDQPPEDTWHCYERLKGRRLVGSCGLLYGVKEPETFNDEPLDELPYIEYFYKYLNGRYKASDQKAATF